MHIFLRLSKNTYFLNRSLINASHYYSREKWTKTREHTRNNIARTLVREIDNAISPPPPPLPRSCVRRTPWYRWHGLLRYKKLITQFFFHSHLAGPCATSRKTVARYRFDQSPFNVRGWSSCFPFFCIIDKRARFTESENEGRKIFGCEIHSPSYNNAGEVWGGGEEWFKRNYFIEEWRSSNKCHLHEYTMFKGVPRKQLRRV